jgi:glutamine synthetase
MQSVARRYGLVCLLHEKPFAGVNGSGKHNNWSMGTDSGRNLLDPGDNPHDNEQFLFFATAVIQAVNKHQGLLRASVASAGQDHRLGANEAPPAIISIFLGGELERVFDALAKGKGGESTPESFLGLGTPVLPRLPMDGGDRNRTSPFAFTGNKFEFRALGSSMSPSFPNTVLNTIVAEAIDSLADQVEAAAVKGKTVDQVLAGVLGKSYKANSKIVFGGDNYDEAWHVEAETKRGLKNLRTTPEALPEVVSKQSIEVFSKYGVLNSREVESRYEVWVEQYITKVNIEAETAAAIARTMLLPASLRHLTQLKEAGIVELVRETEALVKKFVVAIKALEKVNVDHPHVDALKHAVYMRDKVLTAMGAVREVADQLEKVVADDLWPLPKYSEILFIK